MAVPSSGALSLLDMAQECAYGTWGSGSITNPISVRDLVAGGNSYGSGQSYPSINTSSSSYPPSSTPVTFQSFYSYDKDASSVTSFSASFGGGSGKAVCGSSTGVTYYHDGSGTYPAVNDNVYTDSGATNPMADNYYKMANGGLLYVEDEQAASVGTC